MFPVDRYRAAGYVGAGKPVVGGGYWSAGGPISSVSEFRTPHSAIAVCALAPKREWHPGPGELPRSGERPPFPAKFPRSTRSGQIELQLERSADVLIFPQRHHKGRQPDPQRRQTVDPGMASRAQRDQKPGGVLAGLR